MYIHYKSWYAYGVVTLSLSAHCPAGIVTLRFPSIKKGHAGVYKCVAEDKAGKRYTYDVPVQVVNGIGECMSVCANDCHKHFVF